MGVFLDPAAIGAAVDLRCRDVYVLLQKGALAQGIVQGDLRHHVGAVPVGGIQPAFGHHALGGEVDDVGRTLGVNQGEQLVELTIEVDGPVDEVVVVCQSLAPIVPGPAIRQEDVFGFFGSADTQNPMPGMKSSGYEMRARETVAADDEEGVVCHSVIDLEGIGSDVAGAPRRWADCPGFPRPEQPCSSLWQRSA